MKKPDAHFTMHRQTIDKINAFTRMRCTPQLLAENEQIKKNNVKNNEMIIAT